MIPTATMPPSTLEDRFQEAVAAYLQAVDAGETPDFAELLARYPEVADRLRDFLADQDRLRQLTGDARPAAPRSFGDYALLEELGAGGMGVVYKARQISLDRIVALKMIRAGEFATEAERARFHQEARAVAHLDHPHIVPIYEVAEWRGATVSVPVGDRAATVSLTVDFFTMKFMEGGSLARRIADFRLPICDLKTRQDDRGKTWTRSEIEERQSQIVSLMVTLARAMHHAHQRGLLHRDLKPGNVLLDAQDQPHVTDFGLAKRATLGPDARTHCQWLTGNETIVGTAAYMPPEQARAEKLLSTAVDVYGLGAILYELLAGRPPFQADSVIETLIQVRDQEPKPPRKLNPLVNRDLETICLKCLEKDPAKRYGSAEALAQDLDRLSAGKPIRARPVGSWERMVKWARRKPAVAALYAVIGSVILIGACVGLWQWNQTAALLRESQANLYDNSIALAERYLSTGHPFQAKEVLDRTPEELRGWEWHYLKAWWRPDEFSLQGHTAPVLALAYSADGMHLVSGSADGTVRLWDARTGQLLDTFLSRSPNRIVSVSLSTDGRLLAAASPDMTVRIWNLQDHEEHILPRVGALVAFSRDGRWLATAGGQTVTLWNAQRLEKVEDLPHGGAVSQIEFSADSKWLVSAGWGERPVRLWSLTTRREAEHVQIPLRSVDAVAFSPKNLQLATAKDNVIRFWSIEAGGESHEFRGYTGRCAGLAFSPDGKYISATYQDSTTVTIWDADTGTVAFRTRRCSERVGNAAFSPDGARLAFSKGTEVVVQQWQAPIQRPEKQLTVGPGEVRGLAFSPDSRLLASASSGGELKLWDVRAHREIRTLRTGLRELTSLALHDQYLAAASADGRMKVWEVATGKEVLAWQAHTNRVTSLAFVSDGQRVVSASYDRTIKVWNLPEGELAVALEGNERNPDYVLSVSLASDGRRLAAGYDGGSFKLWDLERSRELRGMHETATTVWSVAFRPDGKAVAVGTSEGEVIIRDADSGKDLRVMSGHTGAIKSVAFHPQGRRLVSGGDDGTVKLWDPTTGHVLLTLAEQHRGFSNVACSLDGRFIAAGDVDGTIRLWEASPR